MIHCCMLITILMFILSKFLSLIFFGLIWSQNLKFSKLPEIRHGDTWLYAYYGFNVYFFKIFVSHIVSGKFCPCNVIRQLRGERFNKILDNDRDFLVQNIMGDFRSILFSPDWRNYIVIWRLPTWYSFFHLFFFCFSL